jgi:hypothetical protein
MKDNDAKNIIVKELLNAKIDRLESEISYCKSLIEMKFGSLNLSKEEIARLDNKKSNELVNKLNSLTKLYKQRNEYVDFYNELNNTSFSNANMNNFKTKVKQVFKWNEPMHYDYMFKKNSQGK